jgi:Tol biopolymer transport system component
VPRVGPDRWIGIVVLVVVLMAGLPGLLSAGASARSQVRNGLIFFDRLRESGADIFAVHPDGSGRHRAVRNGMQPSVSRDGRLIVFQGGAPGGFINGDELDVVHADGSHRQVMVSPSEGLQYFDAPSFSPDAKEIVFDDDAGSVWAVNTDGSNLRRLLSLHHRLAPTGAVFAPGGSKILFDESNLQSGRALGMFLMNADGSHVHSVPNTTNRDGGGSFSPSGKTIVFSCGISICRMSVDGSHRHRLTSPPLPVPSNTAPVADDLPRFSPDGKKIVFTRHAGSLAGGRWNGPHGLFIMNPSGSRLHQINGNGDDADPSWQSLP